MEENQVVEITEKNKAVEFAEELREMAVEKFEEMKVVVDEVGETLKEKAEEFGFSFDTFVEKTDSITLPIDDLSVTLTHILIAIFVIWVFRLLFRRKKK